MDASSLPASTADQSPGEQNGSELRSQSVSQKSTDSHTAADFINTQLQLEADAREALPYSIDDCTNSLGPLRQILFACLTCSPPPPNPTDSYTPAGVCYSCSIQCHGEHILVELFNKRNFTCDCGTTRFPPSSPCTLRINPETNTKGGVHSETSDGNNKYNQNFRNRFCGCECDYDPEQQKGTMFQCLGLGTAESGGCGEDWWHPGCVVGVGPDWFETTSQKAISKQAKSGELLEPIKEVTETTMDDANTTTLEKAQPPKSEEPTETAQPSGEGEGGGYGGESEEEDPPVPPGFPQEDDFEGFICYKCIDANPWIRRYAGSPGFLAAVFKRSTTTPPKTSVIGESKNLVSSSPPNPKKRKAEDGDEEPNSSVPAKRVKDEISANDEPLSTTGNTTSSVQGRKPCKLTVLSPAPSGQFSLFFKSDFREHLCRCSDCFPNLAEHPQLLEEEESYEPPLSENGDDAGGSTVGSGSIYERGESALKNIDRVRAIEGVMAYNHLKEKLKPFFQQFAESGQAISAEDIKAHFAKLRGDDEAIKEAGESVRSADNRREQSGH